MKKVENQIRLLMIVLIVGFYYFHSTLVVLGLAIFIVFPRLWLKLGELLGNISTFIIMFVSYIVVLLPFSIFIKTKVKKNRSYFVENIKTYNAEDLKHPF
jgi:glucan phosphoethanolaminetransferase (alkaline phosphatase superfamily)